MDSQTSIAAIGLGKNRTRTTHDGLVYRFSLTRYKGTVTAEVWLDTSQKLDLRIANEGWFDRTGKSLKVNKELQTGDHDFDERFYISSHDEEPIRPLMMNPESRAAVRQVFDLGFKELRQKKTRLSAEARGSYSQCTNLDLDSVARALTILARCEEKLPPRNPYVTQPDSGYISFAAYAFSGMLFAVSILALVSATIKYPPVEQMQLFYLALNYAIPIYVTVAISAFFLLRGRSTSHWELLFVLSLSMLSLPILFMGYCGYVNGMYDVSLPQVHRALVLEKYIQRSKNSHTYHIQVASWRKGHRMETFSVSGLTFNHMIPNSTTVEITTRSGALNIEWVVSKRF